MKEMSIVRVPWGTRRPPIQIIAGLLTAVLGICPVQAQAAQVSLGASRDNTLYENPLGAASNGSGGFMFAGRTNGGALRRAVVHFDLSNAVPAGSTINSVTVTLFMSQTSSGPRTVSLHALQSDWGESSSIGSGNQGTGGAAEFGDATWLHTFYYSQLWGNVGGDFDPVSSASMLVGGDGSYQWSSAGLIQDVEAWANDPRINFGWLLRGDEAVNQTAKRFNTRENSSNPPELTIDFTPPAVFGGCCLDSGQCMLASAAACSAAAGVYQGNGSTCVPNSCPQPGGACCFEDESCAASDPIDCQSQDGVFLGGGSTCDGDPCALPGGACCFDNGLCELLSQQDCSLQQGEYSGDGTSCFPNVCPAGACCFDEKCFYLSPSACDEFQGTFKGLGTMCDPPGDVCPFVLEPFVDKLPIPPVLEPVSGVPGGAAHYEIAMTEFEQQLHRDLPPTRLWGYAGMYPGPTIEATVDQTVTVEWINDLRDEKGNLRTEHYFPVNLCPHGPSHHGNSPRTVVHLHGAHTVPESDGYPEDTLLPGESDLYTYPNHQLPATLWYHDHALGITRLNVYLGLAGFYLLRDEFEAALNLPSGVNEVPLVIQDRMFEEDGSLHYPEEITHAHFGDTMLVNGKVWPYLPVRQGKYRFRLLNGCNARTLTLSLSTGATFQQIGTDGGLLPAPLVIDELTLAPAERADVIVDFALLPAGTEIILTNSAPAPYPGTPGVGVLPNVMKFIVMPEAGHTDPVPAVLRPIEWIDEQEVVTARDFELFNVPEPCAGMMWVINGLTWHNITEFPFLGSTETWRFINRSGMMHPMHMHLVMFQVLDRQPFQIVDGEIVPSGPPVPPDPTEMGWKDTVRANPMEMVRVIARFEDYPGNFAYHCHILDHEDHEMMRQFMVLDATIPAASAWGLIALAGALLVAAAWVTIARRRRAA